MNPSLSPKRRAQIELSLARVFLFHGHLAAARGWAEKVLSENPQSLSALNLLSRISHRQGRLTETLQLWHQLHQLTPSRGSALSHLAVLYRLSGMEHPNDASRYVELAPGVYMPQHPALEELLKAFLAFRQKNFSQALRLCEKTANNHEEKNVAFYKLAVLAGAWMHERLGENEEARQQLTQLGQKRGLETDIDRLWLLAHVCARLDSPATKLQSFNIFKHLYTQHQKLSALPHLISLSRGLSQEEDLKHYEKEYRRQFEKRLPLPSAKDYLRVLSSLYVAPFLIPPRETIEWNFELLKAECSQAESLPERLRLKAAWHFFRREKPRAARLWKRLTASKLACAQDWAYLAESQIESSREAALETFREALMHDSQGNVDLWNAVLRLSPRTEWFRQIPREKLQTGRQLLQRQAQQNHREAQAFFRLSQLETLWGDEACAQRHALKATALEVTQTAPVIGRAHMAAVYWVDEGKPKGLIHELRVFRGKAKKGAPSSGKPPHAIWGNVAFDLRELISSIFGMTLEFIEWHWPHLVQDAFRGDYHIRFSKDDEASSGNSAGLPVAMALVSSMTGHALSPTWAFTGHVVGDSSAHVAVRRVGDVVPKLKGLLHRGFDVLVLPEENRRDIEDSESIPQPYAQAHVRYVKSLEESIEACFGVEAWEW